MTKLLLLAFTVFVLSAGAASAVYFPPPPSPIWVVCEDQNASNYGEFGPADDPCQYGNPVVDLANLGGLQPFGAPECSAVTHVHSVNYGAALTATVDAYCNANPFTMSSVKGSLCIVWNPVGLGSLDSYDPGFTPSGGNCITGGMSLNHTVGPGSQDSLTLDMSLTLACGYTTRQEPIAAEFIGQGESQFGTLDDMADEDPISISAPPGCAWAGFVSGQIG